MRYYSTRNGKEIFSAAEVIKLGLAPDGGLFVPSGTAALDFSDRLVQAGYRERAAAVFQPFLADFGAAALNKYIEVSYNTERFDTPAIAPLRRLNDALFCLELWHGPTCAFKDMALQILPHLLKGSMEITGDKATAVILTATSGDTGKAALEGFRDVPGTRIIVYYPVRGVSKIQERQMVTQEGDNVNVAAVEGNFDDAQTGVKDVFADRDLVGKLAASGYKLSSANSINWGRLVPQIAYYYAAYLELLRNGNADPGEKVNFVVPTGNFGNILAGYYAARAGLPVNRLICASNVNNVLSEFINTGLYNRNRPFERTISPSMDILISSNLERLLFELTGHDAARIRMWMKQLQENGSYRLDQHTYRKVAELFWADFADDTETTAAIGAVYREHCYLIDPHTAVAAVVCEKYRSLTGDNSKTVIVSTASPFKFNESVARAVLEQGSWSGRPEGALLQELSRKTGLPVPPALDNLERKPVLHTTRLRHGGIKQSVLEFLNVK